MYVFLAPNVSAEIEIIDLAVSKSTKGSYVFEKVAGSNPPKLYVAMLNDDMIYYDPKRPIV